MAPFGRHNTNNNNKSLPLIELPTRGIMTKIVQNNWLVWIGYLQFIRTTIHQICFYFEGLITWRTENSSLVGANQVETFVMQMKTCFYRCINIS